MCVMIMNWDLLLISRKSALKRPIFASSRGASTSSSKQNGLGFTRKIEKSRLKAVSVFSPPDSRLMFCGFLPGGCAVMSTPVSRRS